MAKIPRKLLVGLGVLVVGAAALAVFESVRGKRALRAYKTSLIANGEKLRVEELTPRFSAEAHRVASDLIQASWQFRDGPLLAKGAVSTMRFVIPGKARVAWRERDALFDRSTNQWNQLAAELEQNCQALEQIRESLRAREFNFNLNYKEGFNVMLPHLAKLKGLAQRLSAATLNDLHSGNLDDAAANLNALTCLPDALRDEPLVISQLVRIAIAAIAIGPTWEALQAEGWADAQLADLQKRWESLKFMRAIERSIEMERAMGLETFERLRRSSADRKQMFSGAPSGAPQGLATPANASDVPDFALELGKRTLSSADSFFREIGWLWLWSYRDEQRYLEMIQAMLEVARAARRMGSFTAARAQATNKFVRFFQSKDAGSTRYYLAYQIAPALEKASAKAARLETQREMVVAAIALKRYQLRHKRTPPTLAALVPDFVSSVPRDFMDGHELRYRPNTDGTYLLYSVNEDGQDDSGDATPPGDRPLSRYLGNGRDLVWPLPATATEVAEAEAKEPRVGSAAYNKVTLERYGLIPKTNPPPARAK